MLGNITIKINKNQLFLLKNEMEKLLPLTPVEGWETDSCTISLCYQKNIRKLSFFPFDKKETSITFSWAEAFAINNYFSANCESYNVFLRNILEPKLPVCRS